MVTFVKGLPIPPNSVDVVFCSHILEHLSFNDFHKALDNTFSVLKREGIFRCIVPDLELYARDYIDALVNNSNERSRNNASIIFCDNTGFGKREKELGIIGKISHIYGSSHHFWMWDRHSLSKALLDHGFTNITVFNKGDNDDEVMLRPERDHQFNRGIDLQCFKPQSGLRPQPSKLEMK